MCEPLIWMFGHHSTGTVLLTQRRSVMPEVPAVILVVCWCLWSVVENLWDRHLLPEHQLRARREVFLAILNATTALCSGHPVCLLHLYPGEHVVLLRWPNGWVSWVSITTQCSHARKISLLLWWLWSWCCVSVLIFLSKPLYSNTHILYISTKNAWARKQSNSITSLQNQQRTNLMARYKTPLFIQSFCLLSRASL